ncbi:MAG TPA: sigma-54-dependent Fis family transcriptional regulator, partial [Myxococcales bacterium]|nr:sigma-54-dependent Fis family transcriptional regulator [Myxococcales bacterium]
MAKVLLVDDEASMREFLEILLRKEGHEVVCATGGVDALGKLGDLAADYDVVITDLKMPRVGGMEVLERAKQVNSETEVVVMTAYSTTESAIQAMLKGAYDYISKPFKVEEIKVIVQRCVERRRLAQENRLLRGQLSQRYSFSNIIGKSDAINKVFDIIEKVSHSRTSILVSGETGTGKELVARAIHFNSPR